MCLVLFYMYIMHFLGEFTQWSVPCEVSTIIILISKMRKMKPKESWSLNQGHTI